MISHISIRDGITLSLDDVLLIPKYSDIKSRLDVDIGTVLVKDIRLETPVVTAAMDTISGERMGIEIGRLGGAAFLHRFASDEQIVTMVKSIKEESQIAIPSVGIRNDIVRWVGVLLERGADAISIDIAHGHTKMVMDSIALLKRVYLDLPIIAGNVTTKEGVRDLISCGVDAVKVFVGPGSLCKTRVVTGFGYPTFSALCECVHEARKYDIPVIADGGFKDAGDYVKSLAVGANACMSGSMFAGVKETPGKEVKIGNKYYKEYRGMASYEAQKDFRGGLKDGTATEGEAMLVPLQGTAKEVMDYICGGIRSGLTYCGAYNLQELKEKAEFIRVTNSAIREGTPHRLGK